jgi:hypothetical protein
MWFKRILRPLGEAQGRGWGMYRKIDRPHHGPIKGIAVDEHNDNVLYKTCLFIHQVLYKT